MQANKITRQFWISGRVQGVFYRASTREQALRLQLTGYAKNHADGRVEVLACGDEASLQSLEQWLWCGPMAAEVMDVKEEFVEPVAESMNDFSIY